MEFQIPRAGVALVVTMGLVKVALLVIVWYTGSEWLDKVLDIVRVYSGGE